MRRKLFIFKIFSIETIIISYYILFCSNLMKFQKKLVMNGIMLKLAEFAGYNVNEVPGLYIQSK